MLCSFCFTVVYGRISGGLVSYEQIYLHEIADSSNKVVFYKKCNDAKKSKRSDPSLYLLLMERDNCTAGWCYCSSKSMDIRSQILKPRAVSLAPEKNLGYHKL
ncbi:unnamed protein product [Chrysodeixis includens]|uniref:Uncharacterized protein n=1 Tax=Chrysodeixis includens TaxID=689277 RepID=A0A9N8Q259_CHRIL|nr:unnamed protein product [Chrysodeixis includens]